MTGIEIFAVIGGVAAWAIALFVSIRSFRKVKLNINLREASKSLDIWNVEIEEVHEK